jgi:hypothetical protein
MHSVETSSSLVRATRRELGELFRAGTVPAVPDGRARGWVLLGTGGFLSRWVAVLAYIFAWRGKVVDARAGRLKNIVTPLAIRAVEAEVYPAASWYDGEPCIVLDYSRRSLVARKIRDEIRQVAPGVFVGLVFWGRRHILDFALDFTRRR